MLPPDVPLEVTLALHWDVCRTIPKTEDLLWLGLGIMLHRTVWIANYETHSVLLHYWQSLPLSFQTTCVSTETQRNSVPWVIPESFPLHPAQKEKQCTALQLIWGRTALHRLLFVASTAKRGNKELHQLDFHYEVCLWFVERYRPSLFLSSLPWEASTSFKYKGGLHRSPSQHLQAFLRYRCSSWHHIWWA